MKKIVITGCLGYIGSELCKIYSGESRFNKIVGIDNRFVSERVKQLRDWGIDFAQCDILDEEKISELLKDADVIHHLAGITDVAYTKTQENEEKDKAITKTAVEGTNNILKHSPANCKVIFPSTHVVYEGFQDTKFDISEEELTTAVLTYSRGKVQNEKDIVNSKKDYVILRLGSVYGYSTDTMRIGIMPNLFSKMASQDQTIKLFSGGVQYKSVVNIIDVARCFKFMEESDIKNETFHLCSQNVTVKEVADLCKKYNPKLNIVSTNDEIPNLGYTISNKKLLSTGFKFLYDLDRSIQDMIGSWSKKDIRSELEYTVRGEKEYIDARGKISNYELTEPINLIGYIESKKGSVRANHYHPIQEQKCLLVKGKYVSVIKDLSDPDAQIKTQIIKAGDLAVIKPNVAHTMVFLEDSIFLNLVRGEREHENYGITHTIPYTLVDEDMRNEIMNNYSHSCRACKGHNLKPVVSLGKSPLANNLLSHKEELSETFPLEMVYCEDCHNCQLSFVVPADKMFKNYLYVSSTTKSFRDHFADAAQKYIHDFKLNSESVVVDIGSNDGIALKPLKEAGVKVVGVEPAGNVAIMAIYNGIHTITNYFTPEVAKQIEDSFGKVDLITASNVFAHADKLDEIAHSAFSILKEDGSFVVEVQYLVDTIKDLTFDNIYHEHVNYWSVTSINDFFNKLGYCVYKVEHVNTHGGSIRVYIKRNKIGIDSSVFEFLHNEKSFGITQFSTYESFSKSIEKAKYNVRKNIKALKKQFGSLVGYGAPAKATTSLNYYGITSSDIEFIVEDNKLKHDKIIPGVNIPIYPKNKLLSGDFKVVIVMAWNFFEEIKKNNQELIDLGIKFISIKDLQNDKIDL
jgi:nucleoside-diphosphate-sugar epimerase/SAM-dependent methyltransferase/quercetin dioxygenase-like cupin family protein